MSSLSQSFPPHSKPPSKSPSQAARRKVGQILSSAMTNDSDADLPSDIIVRDFAYSYTHVLWYPPWVKERPLEELRRGRDEWVWAESEGLWIQEYIEPMEDLRKAG
jgi:hypothetical protein